MPPRIDIVALGEAMVEFNQVRPGEATWLQGFGGDTSNAVIAAARAGARTAYLTRVGDDSFGRMLLDLWARESVDTTAVEGVAGGETGLYFVSHGPDGHAFSYRRAGSAAARMTPAWLAGAPLAMLRASRWLHVSGISMAISPSACQTTLAAMRAAREAGVQVAFDSNLRLKLWSREEAAAAYDQALPFTDLFLPSLDDMTALCGLTDAEAVANWAHARGARQVVVKLGDRGALVSDGNQRHRLDALPATVVDATGAGDCFAGNLLARLVAGDELLAAARYANAAASLAVQGYGAVAPLPRPDAVRALL
ncbi:sugar kinase [Ramlibacter sp.]|uniref:sugar kinase n=1 Tax=Ramlibacter sp. TaxID=1917967 RepID=UPI0035B2DBA6